VTIRLAAAAMAAVIALGAAGLGTTTAAAQDGSGPAAAESEARLAGRTRVSPNVTSLGDAVELRWELRSRTPVRARFVPPPDEGAFHWSGVGARIVDARGRRMSRRRPPGGWIGGDVYLEGTATLQVFALGDVTVPGIVAEVDDGAGPKRHRLPTVRLTVAPLLTAADSAADLRAARGPVAAPWWERVPWRWVVAVALAVAVAALVWRVALARRRRARPAPAVAAARPRRDPVAEALAELGALRRLDLPAQGRFDEHAFRLTRIARRFLEAVAAATRPGDTTPEVVAHLAGTGFPGEDVRRVEDLLRLWDRVKFARAPSTVEEARSAEGAVEALVRRHAPPAPPTAAGSPAGRAA
jgi:hypothetical protein